MYTQPCLAAGNLILIAGAIAFPSGEGGIGVKTFTVNRPIHRYRMEHGYSFPDLAPKDLALNKTRNFK